MTAAPITYVKSFVATPDAVFQRLWAELEWERRVDAPRREYYANDFERPYVYGSGAGVREYWPRPWHPDMLAIREQLEAVTGTRFEVCFLNGYQDQSDSLGWHADASPEMDPARPIAIVSLGAERDIYFRPKPVAGEPAQPHQAVRLQNGSLCLMHAGMQKSWVHKIPKAGFVCGPRISLTYRGYLDVVPAA